MVLGLPAVRTLALGFSLLSSYRDGSCKSFDYGRYWTGCLVYALAMQAITQRTRVAAAEETFCLGLLVRIGELALATLYPVAYKVKFLSKRELGRDYVVMPLEALWWADDMDAAAEFDEPSFRDRHPPIPGRDNG